MDRLDYIENETRATAAFHIAGAEVLQKEANTLVSLLLAAQGGGVGLGLSLVQREAPLWMLGALLAGIVYLLVLTLVVVRGCLWARDLYPGPTSHSARYD